MLRRRLLLVPIALVLCTHADARAEAPDPATVRARNHMQAAVSYYDDGRYEDAAREIETAYRLKPLPALQYNLAQCYERLGRLGEAIAAYRKYLDGSPHAEDHDLIARRAANLEERL